ncbi:MAG: uroporphyrinogen decarboxylase [Defluviitaleaceae bacterium]|nr:uroporphyrinogen decarboxylase [Defluviitaleaceae bacterium]
MTRRERVIAALNHKKTDIVPYNIGFTQQAHDKMVKYYNDKNFASKIGNHISGCYYSGNPVPIPGMDGYFKDDFGVVWNRNGADKDIGIVEKLLLPEPELKGFELPQIPEESLRHDCITAISNAGDTFKIASLGFSLFERAWTFTGMENLLAYMITDPEFVTALLDKITDFNLKVIKIFLDYDFDGIYFGDDWGQQQGLIMGPVLWRKYIKPQLAKMYSSVKESGRYVAQHSCGDIQEIYPDLVEIGLDAHQTFQPELFDITSIKRQYKGKLAFWGGISTQRLMPFETPQGLKIKAKEIIDIVSDGGGFIAGPTHDIPGDVPAENIAALIELFQNQ